MIAAAVFFSFVSGVAATLLFAMWFAGKPNDQGSNTTLKSNRDFSAVGVSMTNTRADETFQEAIKRIIH